MHILFFLEPFPVRSRPHDYQWILDRWRLLAETLKDNGFTFSFCISDEIAKVNQALPGRVVCPADLGVMSSLLERDEQDSQWVELMKNADQPKWRPFIEGVLNQFKPDLIVTWTVNAPLRAAASKRSVAIMHQELGPLRRDWGPLYFCDPTGVNGESSASTLWDTVLQEPLSPEDEDQLQRFLAEFVLPSGDSPELRLDLSPDGRPIVATFLQAERDSNVLAWSRVKGSAGLLQAVAHMFPADHCRLIVKPHPSEPEPPEVAHRLGFTAVDQAVAAGQLIAAASAICTINSSVGVEAIAAGRPLYVFGQSPYAAPGVTRLAPTAHPVKLESLPLTDLERSLQRRMLRFLLWKYFRTESAMWNPSSFSKLARRWVCLHRESAPLSAYFEYSPEEYLFRELRLQRCVTEMRNRVQITSSEIMNLRELLRTAKENSTAKQSELEGKLKQVEAQLLELQHSPAVRFSERIKSSIEATSIGSYATSAIDRLKKSDFFERF